MPAAKSGAQSAVAGGESAQPTYSARAVARHIGHAENAIRRAIKAGRFTKSLVKNAKGKSVFIDLELAKSEFEASSRTGVRVRTDVRTAQDVAQNGQAETTAAAPSRAEVEASDDDEPVVDGSGQLVFAKTLIDAQTLATNERARKLKFENDVTEGRLVPIESVRKETFETQRIIRENVLNLVARVGGELHAERDLARFLIKFDGCLRQALNTAADDLVAVNE